MQFRYAAIWDVWQVPKCSQFAAFFVSVDPSPLFAENPLFLTSKAKGQGCWELQAPGRHDKGFVHPKNEVLAGKHDGKLFSHTFTRSSIRRRTLKRRKIPVKNPY
jgi:hypothetical protein